MPDWEYVRKELRRDGVTLELLLIESKRAHDDSYSRFCELYREWRGTLDVRIPLNPGTCPHAFRPQTAEPDRLNGVDRLRERNRGHWRVESCHYIIDWNDDEDRSQIRTGFGPENITRLRPFAIGLLNALIFEQMS